MLKITQKEEKDLDLSKLFRDLKVGEIFIYFHDYKRDLTSVKIHQKVAKATSYDGYSLDMASGIMYEVSNTALVIPIKEAELTFTVK